MDRCMELCKDQCMDRCMEQERRRHRTRALDWAGLEPERAMQGVRRLDCIEACKKSLQSWCVSCAIPFPSQVIRSCGRAIVFPSCHAAPLFCRNDMILVQFLPFPLSLPSFSLHLPDLSVPCFFASPPTCSFRINALLNLSKMKFLLVRCVWRSLVPTAVPLRFPAATTDVSPAFNRYQFPSFLF